MTAHCCAPRRYLAQWEGSTKTCDDLALFPSRNAVGAARNQPARSGPISLSPPPAMNCSPGPSAGTQGEIMVFSSSKEWLRHAASIVTSRARASLPFTVAKLPLAHGDRPHTRTTWRPLSTLVVVAALAACGGGGDEQQPAPQSEVPNEVIRGTLTATGGAVSRLYYDTNGPE